MVSAGLVQGNASLLVVYLSTNWMQNYVSNKYFWSTSAKI